MRWRAAVVGVALTVGCSTFGASDSDSPNTPPPPDGGTDGGGRIGDGAVADPSPSPACNLAAPFSPPRPITELNALGDVASARLSADELEVVFEHNQGTSSVPRVDLFIATRARRDDRFEAPRELTNANTLADDAHPFLSEDGLELVFATTRTSYWDIYRSTRTSRALAFGSPTPMTAVNDPLSDDYSPFVSPVTNELWFSRAPVGPGRRIFHLFAAPARGAGAPAQVVTSTKSGTSEEFPVLSTDARTLYVALNDGAKSLIHVATRSTTEAAFSPFTEVPEVNKTASQLPTYLSKDGCRLYLSSVIEGTEKFEIRVAERPR